MKNYVVNNFKAINYQYAVGQSLPSWGDLEGCSTGMATDNSSIISQGFLYAPFGEIISEYTPGWETDRIPKYAFNAKEFDEENGMYYYSARYYAPPTFISRDPMFEKYPSISPYTYCGNNPVGFVDPTGEEIAIVGDENYQKAVGKILLNIYNSGIAGKFLVTQAIKSKKTFVIADTKQGIECGIYENKNASVLPFNLEEANGTYEGKDGGAKFTAESTLAHELAHFVFPQNGFLLKDGKSTLIRAGEVAAVEWENRVRKDLGMGMRKKYDGMYVYGKEIISSKYNGYYNLKDKENYGNTNFSVPSHGSLQISTEKRGTYYMYGGYFDKYLNNPGSKTQKRLKF